MLPNIGEGPRVPAAEHRLDAADETGPFVQAAPGDDEGWAVRPGLFFQVLQSTRAEMNARGLKEGVGTASHAPIVPLRATPGDRGDAALAYRYAPTTCFQVTRQKRT
jgi:hypothetical protein